MRKRSLYLVLALLGSLFTLPPLSTNAAPPPGDLTRAPIRTFPETGHIVKGLFLEYWNIHGQVAQQGFPLSELLEERNPADHRVYWVQYFERAVFEYHTDYNGVPTAPYVALTLLGNAVYGERHGAFTSNPAPAPAGCVKPLPPNGHNLCGRFKTYWETHGGLAQQGYPISEVYAHEHSLTDPLSATPPTGQYDTQYFERAVFEYHPENANTPFEVLLTQLGTVQLQRGPRPGFAYVREKDGLGGTICTGGAGGAPFFGCAQSITAMPPQLQPPVPPSVAIYGQRIDGNGGVLARIFQGWLQVVGAGSHIFLVNENDINGGNGYNPCPTPALIVDGGTGLIDHTNKTAFTAGGGNYCYTPLDTQFSIQVLDGLTDPKQRSESKRAKVKVAVYSGKGGLVITDTVSGKAIIPFDNPLRGGEQVYLADGQVLGPRTDLDADVLRLWTHYAQARLGADLFADAPCLSKNMIYLQATQDQEARLGCAVYDNQLYNTSPENTSTISYFSGGRLLADTAAKPPTVYVLYPDPTIATGWESYPAVGGEEKGDLSGFFKAHPDVEQALGQPSSRQCTDDRWQRQAFAGGTVLDLPIVLKPQDKECGYTHHAYLLLLPTGAVEYLAEGARP